MEGQTETTEITKFEQIAPSIQNAGVLYVQNKESYTKAIVYANDLIERANKGMSPDLYTLIQAGIKKLNATRIAMNDRRKGFTQAITFITKEFTSMESDLSNKGVSIIKMQGHLDAYALKLENEQKERGKIAQKLLNTEKEKVTIVSEYEMSYRTAFANKVLEAKNSIAKLYNDCTLLANIETAKESIRLYNENYVILPITPNKYIHHTDAEVLTVLEKFDLAPLQKEFSETYKKEIQVYKIETIDKFPTKIKQIEDAEALAKKLKDESDAELKIKLEAQAKLIKDAEELKLKEQQDELAKQTADLVNKQQIDINVKSSAENSKINSTIKAQVSCTPIEVKKKKTYVIEIVEVLGYLQIFQFWFENYGKTLGDIEKLSKFTLERMKAYCEKEAIDNDNFIVSEYIKYNEKITGK